MKKLLLIILLAFLPRITYAQKQGKAFLDSLLQKQEGRELVNSLVKKLSTTKDDTNKIMLLDALTFFYANIDPDTGIDYGMQELTLSHELKYDRKLESLYSSLGADYSQKSDFVKGLEYYFQSLKLSEDKGNKSNIQLRMFNISSAYFNMGNYPKALEYANKSLAICEKMQDTLSIGSDYSNIGAIYGQQGNQAKSFEYLFKALDIFEKLADSVQAASALGHISANYSDQKNYKQALEYANKALKINEELGDKEGMIVNLEDIGIFYMGMAGDTAHNKMDSNEPGVYNEQYLQKAVQYWNKGLAISKETGDLKFESEFYQYLSKVYEDLGNYKEEIKAYKEYTTLKDAVYSNDSKLKLAKLETHREAQLTEKEIEINKLEKNKKRNEQTLFIVAILLLLIVIIVVARNFVMQKNANTVKEELLKQKDVLMKEIHHRVKNNLQVISALLDLQLSGITDEQAKNAMSESNTRIRSISLIHQQLYQHENINAIEFSKFSKDLMHQVTSVFCKNGQKIILKNNMPETMLDIDTAVPLGLILNELMTNSYKYAFTNVTEGFMEITLQQHGNYELIYRDSGPGLPAGINTAKVKGLGMKVIRSLSKQIGGELVYVEKDRSFVINFKDISGRKMTD